MVFSEKAMKRAKLICSRLGLDVTKALDLEPSMIQGRHAIVQVEIQPYTDNQTGKEKHRNSVPFAGYDRVDSTEQPESGQAPATGGGSTEKVPF